MSVALSVVIPSYLEEENLRLLLPRVREAARAALPADFPDQGFEVLVVDTETPLDSTAAVCSELGARYVNRRGGNTFGAAVRTGIAEAQGEHLLFMDADGSHSPEFIPKLYEHRDNFDVVIASRYVKGGYTENPSSLVWMSWILNMSYRWVLQLDCYDVSNSFKLYRGEQLRALTLKCSNFDIIEEILFKLNRRFRIRIKEIPFTFRRRMFGDTKRDLASFMVTYVFTLLKLRFSH